MNYAAQLYLTMAPLVVPLALLPVGHSGHPRWSPTVVTHRPQDAMLPRLSSRQAYYLRLLVVCGAVLVAVCVLLPHWAEIVGTALDITLDITLDSATADAHPTLNVSSPVGTVSAIRPVQ